MIDRSEYQLPQNLDAERFILGGILVEPDQFSLVADVLTADDFCLEKHKRIFRRLTDVYERGERINRVSLINDLMKHGQLESVDGFSYLASLDEGMPSLANIESFCRIVHNKSVLRQTINAAQSVIERCLAEGDEPEDLVSAAERVTNALNATQNT